MAQPTEGPWTYRPTTSRMRDEYSQPFGITGLGDRTLIAGVFGDVTGGIEVAEANARLLAASRDLLKGCQKAKDFLVNDLEEPGRTIFWTLVDAIRKATGETP